MEKELKRKLPEAKILISLFTHSNKLGIVNFNNFQNNGINSNSSRSRLDSNKENNSQTNQLNTKSLLLDYFKRKAEIIEYEEECEVDIDSLIIQSLYNKLLYNSIMEKQPYLNPERIYNSFINIDDEVIIKTLKNVIRLYSSFCLIRKQKVFLKWRLIALSSICSKTSKSNLNLDVKSQNSSGITNHEKDDKAIEDCCNKDNNCFNSNYVTSKRTSVYNSMLSTNYSSLKWKSRPLSSNKIKSSCSNSKIPNTIKTNISNNIKSFEEYNKQLYSVKENKKKISKVESCEKLLDNITNSQRRDSKSVYSYHDNINKYNSNIKSKREDSIKKNNIEGSKYPNNSDNTNNYDYRNDKNKDDVSSKEKHIYINTNTNNNNNYTYINDKINTISTSNNNNNNNIIIHEDNNYNAKNISMEELLKEETTLNSKETIPKPTQYIKISNKYKHDIEDKDKDIIDKSINKDNINSIANNSSTNTENQNLIKTKISIKTNNKTSSSIAYRINNKISTNTLLKSQNHNNNDNDNNDYNDVDNLEVFNKLYNESVDIELRKYKLRKEHNIEEMKECTFQPVINNNYISYNINSNNNINKIPKTRNLSVNLNHSSNTIRSNSNNYCIADVIIKRSNEAKTKIKQDNRSNSVCYDDKKYHANINENNKSLFCYSNTCRCGCSCCGANENNKKSNNNDKIDVIHEVKLDEVKENDNHIDLKSDIIDGNNNQLEEYYNDILIKKNKTNNSSKNINKSATQSKKTLNKIPKNTFRKVNNTNNTNNISNNSKTCNSNLNINKIETSRSMLDKFDNKLKTKFVNNDHNLNNTYKHNQTKTNTHIDNNTTRNHYNNETKNSGYFYNNYESNNKVPVRIINKNDDYENNSNKNKFKRMKHYKSNSLFNEKEKINNKDNNNNSSRNIYSTKRSNKSNISSINNSAIIENSFNNNNNNNISDYRSSSKNNSIIKNNYNYIANLTKGIKENKNKLFKSSSISNNNNSKININNKSDHKHPQINKLNLSQINNKAINSKESDRLKNTLKQHLSSYRSSSIPKGYYMIDSLTDDQLLELANQYLITDESVKEFKLKFLNKNNNRENSKIKEDKIESLEKKIMFFNTFNNSTNSNKSSNNKYEGFNCDIINNNIKRNSKNNEKNEMVMELKFISEGKIERCLFDDNKANEEESAGDNNKDKVIAIDNEGFEKTRPLKIVDLKDKEKNNSLQKAIKYYNEYSIFNKT